MPCAQQVSKGGQPWQSDTQWRASEIQLLEQPEEIKEGTTVSICQQ